LTCGFVDLASVLVIDDSWTTSAPTTATSTSKNPIGIARMACIRDNPWLDGSIGDPIAVGLARNPAAPLDVLLRLLDDHPEAVPAGFRRRADLPPPVVETASQHPSARVRGAIASNPHLDLQVRLRLLDDPEFRVAVLVQEDPDPALRGRAFTLELDRLVCQFRRGLMTPDELRGEVIEVGARDWRTVRVVATHPEPLVRAAAVELFTTVDEASHERLRQALLNDEEPEVRAATAHFYAERERVQQPSDLPRNGYAYRELLRSRPLSPALVEHVLASDRMDGIAAMAANPGLPRQTVAELFIHPSAQVRCSLANRDDLTPPQLTRLAADPDVSVRTAASVHPGLTEPERAAIDIDVTTAPGGGWFDHASWHPWMAKREPHPVLAESIRLSASVNPLLRRRAAVDSRLPTAVVITLADDPDLGVRALLAQHHPAAPPALLLRVFREYHRCGRGRLPTLPNFPTTGLAHLAHDPDPEVRRLIARDPLAHPSQIGRLTEDPDDTVRHAMAACPRLPVHRIVELLDDAELAESAAANPSLPVDVMRDRLASARACGFPR
jgi:hypothetical protein